MRKLVRAVLFTILLVTSLLLLKFRNENFPTKVSKLRDVDDCGNVPADELMMTHIVSAFSKGPACDLGQLQWPYFKGRRPGISARVRQKPFNPQVSRKDKYILLELLRALVKSFSDNGLNHCYFVCGGTLLGTYRHHGLIPWDDDIDLCFRKRCIRFFLKLFNKTSPFRYAIDNEKIKFYPTKDAFTNYTSYKTVYGWRWPAIDLMLLEERGIFMYQLSREYGFTYRYLKKDIYPQIYRPFENIWVPTPKTIDKIVKKYYSNTICKNFGYSHVNEQTYKSDVLWCHKLIHIYAFIDRKKAPYSNALNNSYSWNIEYLKKADNKTENLYLNYVTYHKLFLPQFK